MRSKHFAKLLLTLGAMTTALAFGVAAARATTPAPGYEEFAGCPSPAENSNIEACLVSTIAGGHFQMGSKDVPITKPITLSAGISSIDGALVFGSKGGLTLAKQQVPGGLVGLTGLDWLVNFLSLEDLKLYAVTELVGVPDNPFINDPFSFPIRVHLINPVIGNNCYVGTTTNPIKLELTIETTNPPPPNKPISGKTFEIFELDPERPGVILTENGTFVDNAFAAPAASGCRLNLGLIHIGIDGLVNQQSGLPSPAGTNETVQEVDGALSFPEFVYP